MARPMKLRNRKTPPQLRVRTTIPLLAEYKETAKRFGYGDVSPFVRRLMDAAKKAEPGSWIINLQSGSDRLRAA